ncbi:unnamed protein product [Cunninghamella echinulata]
MYAAPNANGSKTNSEMENYLLGKRSVDELLKNKAAQESLTTDASERFALTNSNANTERDIQAKIREDPLFAIKQKQQAALKSMVDNPILMEKLRKKDKKDKKRKKRILKKVIDIIILIIRNTAMAATVIVINTKMKNIVAVAVKVVVIKMKDIRAVEMIKTIGMINIVGMIDINLLIEGKLYIVVVTSINTIPNSFATNITLFLLRTFKKYSIYI